MPTLTRANTTPGSPERKAVYAREFKARVKKSEYETGVSYGKQRRLRALYPLTHQAHRKVVEKYGRNAGMQETRYAVHRAHIARAYEHQGKDLTVVQKKAVRLIKGVPLVRGNPVEHLAKWYEEIGMPFSQGPGTTGTGEPLPPAGKHVGWRGLGPEPDEPDELDYLDYSEYDFGEYSG
jgi:hypothetical protein